MNNTASGIYPSDQVRRWNTIARYGWPMVISSSTWAITIALITLLYQAVAVRLFVPYTMALFSLLSEDHREWYVDQFRVAMANTKSPLGALASTPAQRSLLSSWRKRHRQAWGIAFLWLLGAIVLTVFPFLLPLVLARGIPVVQGVPGSVEFCSPMLNFSTWMASAHYDKLLSLDMMRSVDARGYNFSATNATSVGLPHDKDRVVISSDCPSWAPVCERNNSLRVDIDFWVKQSDSGVASKTASENAEFGVLNTCYKLQGRSKLLQKRADGADTYGLLYGTTNTASGTPYVTEEFTPAERFGYGYNLFAYSNTTRKSRQPVWEPNSTLAHDGDLTILFYHIGNILSPGPSDDPVFGTTSAPLNGSKTYIYTHGIIPIICNTSYTYCPSQDGDCVSLRGNDAVSEYVYKHENSSNRASLGFLKLMWINTWIPLFHVITGSSESVYASRTLSLGSTQLAPRDISGHAEIVRLALTSRMLLLTSANRAVAGWLKYVSPGLPVWTVDVTEEQLATCRLTLMEQRGKITTSAWVILIIVLTGGVLLLLSFTGPLLRYFFWKRLCVFTIRWRLRTAPHLHRIALERGDPSLFWPGDATDEWPTGRGFADRVGLVETFTGYHAVYAPDAQLRYAPKHTSRRLDEMGLTGSS
ncbi:hypothetical protein AUP68_02432 [Ilyonectria robusta]